MVNVKNEGCEFYKLVITFKDAGEDRIAYVDSDHDHREMFSKSALFTDVLIKPVKPTQEQIDRLAEVNALDLTNAGNWAYTINNYVQYGYIKSSTDKIVGELYSPAVEESSKKHLLDVLSAKLATYRYEKEISGVNYGELIVQTDRESQATATSTIVALQGGLIDHVNFKFKNGWKALGAGEFLAVATLLSVYVNSCFAAEEMTINTLANLPFEELDKIVYPEYVMDMLDEEEVDEPLNIYDMFDSNLASLLPQS